MDPDILEPIPDPKSSHDRPEGPADGGGGDGVETPSLRPETLVALLEDESPVVWRTVRKELDRCGEGSVPILRQVLRDGGPRARARARLVLLGLGRERVARRLVGFSCQGATDLERGLLLLSRLEEPDLDLRPFVLALDAMAAEVGRRIEGRPPGVERCLELCRYLGDELGYLGDEEDYHHPDNIYLHRTIVRKRGMPLTLTALYLFVARRAGIPAAPVALPGHVVLRMHATERPVLVDPFRGGVEISERECLQYLADHGLPFLPNWFADATDRALFERHCRNLRASYEPRGLHREVRLLDRVLHVLGSRGTESTSEFDTAAEPELG